jgi:hypothetical protein
LIISSDEERIHGIDPMAESAVDVELERLREEQGDKKYTTAVIHDDSTPRLLNELIAEVKELQKRILDLESEVKKLREDIQ